MIKTQYLNVKFEFHILKIVNSQCIVTIQYEIEANVRLGGFIASDFFFECPELKQIS